MFNFILPTKNGNILKKYRRNLVSEYWFVIFYEIIQDEAPRISSINSLKKKKYFEEYLAGYLYTGWSQQGV